MPENVLIGSEVLKFGTMELHRWLQKLEDTCELDAATMRYLKRAGAAQEPMGRMPRRFVGTFAFVGKDWRAERLKVERYLEENPKGLLVHPVYGEIRVIYRRTSASVEPPTAVNASTATYEFHEDNVDGKLNAQAAQGVAAKRQAIDSAIDALELASALFTGAAASITTLVTSAGAFASAAEASANEATADPSVATQLDQVGADAQSAIEQLRDDEEAEDDIDAYDAIAAVESLYAACQELRDAALAAKPPLELYTVPSTMSVYTLAGIFYGPDGLARADEVLANNPDIANPAAIPPGTVLIMASPTV